MGMDLHSERGGRFWFDIFSWRKILALIKRYGWKPAGTKKPADWENPEHLWDGNYFDNVGQIVTAEDALAMGDALKLALCDLDNSLDPEEWTETRSEEITDDPLIKALMQEMGGPESDIEARVLAASKSPLEFFQGEAGEKARAFIHFCRGGSFTIW
jgi:hypothetical protein